MSWIDDLNAMPDVGKVTQFQGRVKTNPAATPKKNKGNLFTSLVPTTLGSTGGALGGAAIGATAGSVVPVVGTIAGGLLGALIGGAAGGAGGKVVENKLEGNSLGDGVGKEALISGLTSVGPGQLIKGAKVAKAGLGALKGSKAVTPSLTSALAGTSDELAQTGGKTLQTSLAGKADAFGDKMLSRSQYGVISKPGIRQLDPAGTTKQLYGMGLTKNTDIERTAQAITGSDGELNKAVATAVGKAGPLDLGGLPKTIETSIKNSGLVDSKAKGLTNEIMADVNLIDPTNPKSALDAMRNIKALQQQYLGKGGTYHLPDSSDIKRAKALGKVHDDIENTLYNKAGANNNLSGVLTPDLEKKLLGLHPNNQQWAAHVKNNIMTAKTVGELRSAQAPFVKASKLIDEGAGNAYSAGGQMVNNTNGLKGLVVDSAVNLIKNPAERAIGATAKKVAPMLPGGATVTPVAGANNLQAALGALGTTNKGKNALGVGRVAGRNTAGQVIDNATEPQPVDAAGLDQQLIDQYNQQPDADPNAPQLLEPDTAQQPANDNPFAPENATANIQKILANGGTMKDVTQYVSLVQAMQDLQPKGAETELNSQARTSLAASANGVSTLEQLEGLFSNAGGGKGKLGGALANAGAKAGLNSNVQGYSDLAASSVSQLAKALNGGGQVSDTDAAVVIQALPKITDSPQVARIKFNALKKRLETARQNTMLYGSGGGDQATQGVQ